MKHSSPTDDFRSSNGHNRLAILVLGMHQSGTSAVAGAVHRLGADLPAHMLPAAADNPSGFFGAFGVVSVNDWILRSGGSTWYDSLGFSDPADRPAKRRPSLWSICA